MLLEVGVIREIKHPDWLANLVMVPKKDKTWRVRVDFKDLNKACPKDPFPLPASIKLSTLPRETTHCVSSTHTPDTTKSRWRSPIKPQRHSSPHTAPSVLTPCLSGSNAGATYQRMIQTCLETQIGKIVEAYVDDVVIKTTHVESLINELKAYVRQSPNI